MKKQECIPFISIGNTIYFYVSKKTLSKKHKSVTSNVSIQLGDYLLKGTTYHLGHHSEIKNALIKAKFMEKYPAAWMQDAVFIAFDMNETKYNQEAHF